MRFFEQQRKARDISFWLALCFALTVALLSCVFGFGFSFFLSKIQVGPFAPTHGQMDFMDPLAYRHLLMVVGLKFSGVVAFFICVSSAIRSHGLVDGHSVADRMGGTQLLVRSEDPLERRLQNVVEEMAIASGVSLPAIYVLKAESSINAFAAGELKNHQVIAVTQGALENLTRDELQAVVGHEFSHILNGDMGLNMKLAGYVSGIVIFFEAGKFILHSRRSRLGGRSHDGLWLLGLFLLVVGAGGVFMARLLQQMVSRQRELLADASSAQFTRNPQALARALARIKWMTGSKLLSPATLQFSNFFFAEADVGVLGFLGEPFSSHPPLEERIRLLDPHFDRESFVNEGITRAREMAAQDLASIPEPPSPKLELAQLTLGEIPDRLRTAAADSLEARAVIIGAILSRQSETIQERVFPMIEDAQHQNLAHESMKVAARSSAFCLVLIQLSLTSLKRIPLDERRKLREILRKIFNMDGKIEFFEILQVAVIENILEIRPHVKTQITNAKTINSQIQRVLLLIRLRKPGQIQDMDMLSDDLRVLQRLAPKLKQEFVTNLCQCYEVHEKRNPWHEDSIRLVCLCLAVPVP